MKKTIAVVIPPQESKTSWNKLIRQSGAFDPDGCAYPWVHALSNWLITAKVLCACSDERYAVLRCRVMACIANVAEHSAISTIYKLGGIEALSAYVEERWQEIS